MKDIANKKIAWNEEKNELLKATRGISFEEIQNAFKSGQVLKYYKHQNKEKYPNQTIADVLIEGYVWKVAFVVSETELFLKTAYPSRKATKDYKGEEE